MDEKEYQRAYYRANKEKIRERNRLWNAANPERLKERRRKYANEHREKLRAYWRQYYHDNKERLDSRSGEYHRQYYQANKERHRARSKSWNYKNKYGLTVEEWDAKFAAQGKCCAVCSSPDPNHKAGWHTDHCHATGMVRGIVCAGCNMALGAAKDSPDRLRKLADYIERYRSP